MFFVVSAGVTELGPGGSTHRRLSHVAGKLVLTVSWEGFPGASSSEESACSVGDRVRSLGWEDLEKGMATHFSILAWRSP